MATSNIYHFNLRWGYLISMCRSIPPIRICNFNLYWTHCITMSPSYRDTSLFRWKDIVYRKKYKVLVHLVQIYLVLKWGGLSSLNIDFSKGGPNGWTQPTSITHQCHPWTYCHHVIIYMSIKCWTTATKIVGLLPIIIKNVYGIYIYMEWRGRGSNQQGFED